MNTQIKSISISLIAIAAVLGMLWYFIDLVVGSINKLQATVASSIMAASIAAVAAFLVNVYVKHKESKEKILQEMRAKKTPVYEEFIEMIFASFLAEKRGNAPLTQEELTKRFAEITPKIVTWGSEGLIKHWNKIRSTDFKTLTNPVDMFKPLDDFLLIVRKDLGHSNKGLGPLAMMRLFVNDIPEK